MDVIDRIPPLRLDRSRQAAPQVFESLRELIVSLDLPPGTVLPRAALAERYGLSQTPVRDALTKLGEEGLVDIFAQHVTLVSRIDIPSALRAHFLRLSLELEIVHRMASLAPAKRAPLVQRMRAHLQRQSLGLKPQDYAQFTSADLDFHRELYEAAGMSELWQLVRQRSGHVDRLRRLNLPAEGKAQAVVRDHGRIVDALAAGDPLAAAKAVRTHLAGTLTFVDEVRQRYPEFVSG